MNKILLSVVGVLVLVAGGLYLFRAPLLELAKERITADMFVSADKDAFDPGLPIGSSFPAILAEYRGRQLTDTSQFIHDKGMIFIANRSVDW
jgi:hypothetical protein